MKKPSGKQKSKNTETKVILRNKLTPEQKQ
jgi:hypothetical protein